MLEEDLGGGIAAGGCGLGRKLLFLLPNFSIDVFLPSPLFPSRLSSPGRGAAESQKLASVGI